jgi:hypothetical protein
MTIAGPGMWACRSTCTFRVFAVLGATLLFASGAQAASIAWYSATAAGGSDEPFISQLQTAGHSVTRFPAVQGTNLSDADITNLNAFDLVIIGRATASADFDDATDETNWNTRITKKVMIMSAFLTRMNRLGWQSGNNVPDSAPTPLVAVDSNHPVFAGVPLNGDGTMQNNYNIQIDRGTSQIGDALPAGAIVIARNPAVANGIAIAEWPSGTSVFADGGSYSLAANRYFFAGGSREVDGGALTTAGQYDLTQDGQRLFVNFVNYALIPEPSACGLLVAAGAFALRRTRRS